MTMWFAFLRLDSRIRRGVLEFEGRFRHLTYTLNRERSVFSRSEIVPLKKAPGRRICGNAQLSSRDGPQIVLPLDIPLLGTRKPNLPIKAWETK